MGRRKLTDSERKFQRSFTVPPRVWENWRIYCGRRSMSDVLETAMLRLMDEDSDIMSLKEQCVALQSSISKLKHRMGTSQIEMETKQTKLQHLESRIDEMKMSNKVLDLDKEREMKRKEEVKETYLPVFAKYPSLRNRLFSGRSQQTLEEITDFEFEHLVDELSFKTAFGRLPRREVREIIEVCWVPLQNEGGE